MSDIKCFKVNLFAFLRSSNVSQPIWLTNMNSYSSDICINTRNKCPSTTVSSCVHSEDITVECSEFTKS